MKRSEVPGGPRPTSNDSRAAAPAPPPSTKKSRKDMVPDTTALESSSTASGKPVAAAAAAPVSGTFAHTPAKASHDVAAGSKGGHGARIRLPDKLMEYLNGNVEPDILWWQSDEGFAFDSTRVQTEFLDKHFEKTKLKSFIRSLNRWGFRRIFFHTLPKTIYTFSHPLFKKDNPELAKDMKMVSYSGQQQAEMEEFNRQRKDEGFVEQTPAQQPANLLLSPAASPQPATLSPASLLQQPFQPAAAVNPMGRLPGQLDQLQLQLLQQHQLQQELAQRLDQQSMAQSAFLQSMLSMAPQPQVQEQQSLLFQALLAGQQQQQQQLPSSQPGVPTNLLQYQHPPQHQQPNALAHFFGAQGRLEARQQQDLESHYATSSATQEESKDRTSTSSTAPTVASDESHKQQQVQHPPPNNQ